MMTDIEKVGLFVIVITVLVGWALYFAISEKLGETERDLKSDTLVKKREIADEIQKIGGHSLSDYDIYKNAKAAYLDVRNTERMASVLGQPEGNAREDLVMNAIKCNVPARYIREMLTGESEEVEPCVRCKNCKLKEDA